MSLANRYRLWVRLLLMVGAVGMFVLGYQWGNRVQHRRAEPPTIGGVLIRPPATVPAFRLADPSGRIFDRERLAAGWTVMAFADLSQPGGRLAVRRLIEVYNRVSDREGLYRALRLVLVNRTDAPDQARGLAALSPALYVLGGEPTEVRRLAESLGADAGDPSQLFVFAPGGRLVALFTDDQAPAGLASDLVALYESADLLLPEEP
jgi:hypothetical protein